MAKTLTVDHIFIILFFLYLLRESVRKINETESINSYAIGNKTFSVFSLGATITATWISGSGFALDLTEFYREGITYFIASVGMCLNLTIIGYFFAPKMISFLGKTSVASIMGTEYGFVIRNITSILGCIYSCGGIAIQFKIMGNVINHFMGLDYFLCTIMGGGLITFYTYSGGIRSVVRTDIVQAICFTIALIVAIVAFDTEYQVLSKNNLSTPEDLSKFHVKHLLTLTGKELIDLILLTGYFLIPGLSPQVIQRVSMAKDITQLRRSYLYSSGMLFIILVLSCYISYLIFLVKPDMIELDKGLLSFLIDSYTIYGTQAILVIGIISMCMSTADSGLNISAVLIANDLFIFKDKTPLQKMLIARRITLAIGACAIYYSNIESSLLSTILLAASFYLPIISVPLLGIVYGYKTTERCCLLTMILCFIFVITFKFIIPLNIDINFIGMILNLVLLISLHYLIEKWEVLKCFGITSKLKEIKNV